VSDSIIIGSLALTITLSLIFGATLTKGPVFLRLRETLGYVCVSPFVGWTVVKIIRFFLSQIDSMRQVPQSIGEWSKGEEVMVASIWPLAAAIGITASFIVWLWMLVFLPSR
jgi:hypothetical protein